MKDRYGISDICWIENNPAHCRFNFIWTAKSTKQHFSTTIRYLALLEFLLILSEFNLQHINGSVCEFYMLFMTLRMAIKKTHHKTNQENRFWTSCFVKIIRINVWSSLYPWQLTLNAMILLPWHHSIDFMKTCSIHAKHERVRSTLQTHNSARNHIEWPRGIKIEGCLYALQLTLITMRLLMQSNSIDFIKMFTLSRNDVKLLPERPPEHYQMLTGRKFAQIGIQQP